MSDIQVLSEYIAPWALPREDIPIHLVWEPSFDYDAIRIDIPEDVIIKEFFNVGDFSNEAQTYLIKSLKTKNFFGFVIASKDIFTEYHVTRDILISFIKNEDIIYSKLFKANIFRPYVTVSKPPSEITISDKTRLDNLLHIKLKLSGFGKITLHNEVSTGGEFKTRTEPLFREMMRSFFTTFKNKDLVFEDKGIKINPEYLERKALEYVENIKKGIIPIDFNEEIINEFREWVTDDDNRLEVMNFLSKSIENMLVNSIIYHLEKYPEDNINMPEGKPFIKLEKVTEQIRLRFRYKDAVENEYEPILININIVNKNKNKFRKYDIPINIEWEIERLNPLEGVVE